MLRTGAIGVAGIFVVNGGNLEIFRDMWDESTVTGCGSRYLSLGHALFIYLFNNYLILYQNHLLSRRIIDII